MKKSIISLLLLISVLIGWADLAHGQKLTAKPVIIGAVCKRNAEQYARAKQAQAINYPQAYLNYYVHHYTLELEADFTNQALIGHTGFHFRPTGRLDSLVFDLADALNIDSVRYQGQRVSSISRRDNLVYVPLPQGPRALDTLDVWYSGQPGNTGLGSISFANHGRGNVVATLSEPYGARDWWATRQDYFQKIDSIDILLTTNRSGYMGVSNGTLVDTFRLGNKKVWHWKQNYPMVNYLVAIAISNYGCIYDTTVLAGGVLDIRNCYFPQNQVSWQQGTPLVKGQLKTFEQLFRPYPFHRHGYSHTQFTFGGGMEHQTNSFMANLGFDLQAHELGHQWFGDYITCKGMREIWLNEGFATYCEYLIRENLRPTQAAGWRFAASNGAASNVNGRLYKADTADVWGIFDYATTYQKGGMVLHTLRKTIGDSAFFKGVRRYLADTIVANSFARTGDLARNMSLEAGTNLQPFFNAWVYGAGYPNYTLQNTRMVGDTLVFTLNQTPSSAQGPFFPGAMPLSFGNGAATDTTIYVNHQTQGQLVKIRTRYRPTEVYVNWSDDAVTTDRTFTVAPPTSLSTPTLDNELILLPNPVTDELVVAAKGSTTIDGQIRLFDGQGRLVLTAPYQGGQRLNVSMLTSGIYQVEFMGDGGRLATKLVKQ